MYISKMSRMWTYSQKTDLSSYIKFPKPRLFLAEPPKVHGLVDILVYGLGFSNDRGPGVWLVKPSFNRVYCSCGHYGYRFEIYHLHFRIHLRRGSGSVMLVQQTYVQFDTPLTPIISVVSLSLVYHSHTDYYCFWERN